MKKLFAAFWNRNLAFAKLAIVTNLEYRFNYFIDALVQPTVSTVIEILLWMGVFAGAKTQTIAGYGIDSYLSYVLWAAFFTRISTSWMYEFRMIEEISSGSINGIIVRPMGFYEYYLSQLMGYKIVTTVVSLIVPVSAVLIFNMQTDFTKLPLSIILCLYYLILVHTISFLASCMAFYFTKISSFTVAKNLALWILMGELFPLDLVPSPYKEWMINSPFAAGAYLPVGYITGRVDLNQMIHGFVSVTIAIIVLNILGYYAWNKSLQTYSGTGA